MYFCDDFERIVLSIYYLNLSLEEGGGWLGLEGGGRQWVKNSTVFGIISESLGSRKDEFGIILKSFWAQCGLILGS